MNKFLWSVVVGLSFSLIACHNGTKIQDDKKPETFVRDYVKNMGNLKAKEYVQYISKESLKELEMSMNYATEELKKQIEQLKFIDFKVLDVIVNNTYHYDDNTAIVWITEKFKTSKNQNAQFLDDYFVTIKEDNHWKINYNAIIKHYHYNDRCGEVGVIKLCISDVYIYPEDSVFSGKIINASHDKYTFGFASPASTLTVLQNESKVYGNYPAIGHNQSNAKVYPGEESIKFFFNGLIKDKPNYFAINKLVKLEPSGLPGFSNKRKQINVYLTDDNKSDRKEDKN